MIEITKGNLKYLRNKILESCRFRKTEQNILFACENLADSNQNHNQISNELMVDLSNKYLPRLFTKMCLSLCHNSLY